MSGSGGVSVTRAIRDENRFYHPPPIRRLQQQERERQLQEEENRRKQQQEEEMEKKKRRNAIKMRNRKNKRVTGSEEMKPSDCSVSGRVETEASNLDRFLEYTTPVVPAQRLPRATVKDSRNPKTDSHLYYVLGDLWDSFMEWSVYGVGVPLTLNGDNSVVQYYVPYLSGIQLYMDSSRHGQQQRRPGEDSDADSFRETTSSEDSSDCGPGCHRNAPNVNIQSLSGLSLNDKSLVGSSSDESEICISPGRLVFEYFEHEPPFGREPLADKISKLAARFPELNTYRSCKLSPSSWLSVAWYPIYRIPVGPTLQNLDACFLTFHFLSTSMRGYSVDGSQFHISHGPDLEVGRSCCSSSNLPLRTFGLASYKFKASFWNPNGSQECHRVTSLGQAAENWLRGLRVDLPDYRFFIAHSRQFR